RDRPAERRRRIESEGPSSPLARRRGGQERDQETAQRDASRPIKPSPSPTQQVAATARATASACPLTGSMLDAANRATPTKASKAPPSISGRPARAAVASRRQDSTKAPFARRNADKKRTCARPALTAGGLSRKVRWSRTPPPPAAPARRLPTRPVPAAGG